jgi:hypothetical protein
LTAEVSHLLDLQPCWLLLGLAPTGKRRLITAHATSRHQFDFDGEDSRTL